MIFGNGELHIILKLRNLEPREHLIFSLIKEYIYISKEYS